LEINKKGKTRNNRKKQQLKRKEKDYVAKLDNDTDKDPLNLNLNWNHRFKPWIEEIKIPKVERENVMSGYFWDRIFILWLLKHWTVKEYARKILWGKLITKHLKREKGIKKIFNIPLNCHSHCEYFKNLVRALSNFNPDSSCPKEKKGTSNFIV